MTNVIVVVASFANSSKNWSVYSTWSKVVFFPKINTKHINTVWAERTILIVKPVGASSTQSVLKGKLTILQDLISIINISMRITTHSYREE